jgi:(p)ppGpp synthase/HD superfamily hydrolase
MWLEHALVRAAADLATSAHAGQARKYGGGPYVEHPRRVAARVAAWPGATPEMVAAAHLHDVLEDTRVTAAEIAAATSPAVAALVEHLTNRSKPSGASRAERKRLDRERLRATPPAARVIKLCDRLDNLGEMARAPRDFLRTYLAESQALLDEALAGTDAALEAELREVIARGRARLDADPA